MNTLRSFFLKKAGDVKTERARMSLFRILFFGLAAFDIWSVMLEHAARYGAGGFNVSHLPVLDRFLPTPTPFWVSLIWLLAGFACLRAALGIGSRASMTVAACAYFGVYLWSQVDSYQHHYLVSLIMVLCALAPADTWRLRAIVEDDDSDPDSKPRSTEEGPSRLESTPRPEKVEDKFCRHPIVYVLYAQVALVYFWTAVAKCNGTWLTGATLDRLTSEPTIRHGLQSLLAQASMTAETFFATAAWATTLGEFFAAFCFLIPGLRLLGLALIPWFHIGVEALGLDIEWFSYYMLAIDFVLLTPGAFFLRVDALFVSIAHRAERVWSRLRGSFADRAFAIALYLGTVVTVSQVPLESGITLSVFIGLWLAIDQIRRHGLLTPWAFGNLLCAFAMISTVYVSESAYDYYRLWGGDLRRRGQPVESANRYLKANMLKPDAPARRLQLARLYLKMDRKDEAIDVLNESIQIFSQTVERHRRNTFRDPTNANLKMDLAEDLSRLADRHGELAKALRNDGPDSAAHHQTRVREISDEAISIAKESLDLSPIDQRRARRLLRQLQRTKQTGTRR